MNDDFETMPLDQLRQRAAELNQAALVHPDADPETMPIEQLRQRTHLLARQAHAPELAKAQQEVSQEGQGSTAAWAQRQVFGSLRDPIASVVYGKAVNKLNSGTADEGDFRVIARRELQQQEDAKAGVGASALGTLMSLPGHGVLFGLGGVAAAPIKAAGVLGTLGRIGAQTVATPHLYVGHAAQANAEAGRDPLDPRGFPKAIALAGAQNIALSSVGHAADAMIAGKGVLPAMGRTLAEGAIGVPVQAATDVATSVVGLDTGYGIFGSKDINEAAKSAINTAIMFSAFKGSRELPKLVASRLKQAAAEGKPAEVAAKEVMPLIEEAKAAQEAAQSPKAADGLVIPDAIARFLPKPAEKPAEARIEDTAKVVPTPPEPNVAVGIEALRAKEAADPFLAKVEEQIKALPPEPAEKVADLPPDPPLPPAPKLSLAERAAARGRQQASETAPRLVDTSVAKNPFEEVPPEVKIDFNDAFDKAGLTPRERHALTERVGGREQTDIASDAPYADLSGGRENVRLDEKRAIAKLAKHLGVDLSDVKSVEEAYSNLRRETAAEMKEARDNYQASINEEGKVTGIGSGEVVPKEISDYEKAVDKFIRAAEANRVTPEQLRVISKLGEKHARREAEATIGVVEQEATDAGDATGFVNNLSNNGRQLWMDDAGAIDITGAVEATARRFRSVLRHIREFSQAQYSRTNSVDPEASVAMSRHTAASMYGRQAGPFFTDLVLGKDATPADRLYVGAIATEMHLRETKAFHEANKLKLQHAMNKAIYDLQNAKNPADASKARRAAAKISPMLAEATKNAREVKTVFTQPESPIKNDADFYAGLQSKRFLDAFAKYQQEVAPLHESMFRAGNGMEPTDPIPPSPQVPGFPMTLLPAEAPDAASTNKATGGSSSGDPYNLKVKRLGMTRQRTGAAEHGYNLDFGEIIGNSFAASAKPAARAKLDLYLADKGHAVVTWKGGVKEINGEKTEFFPFSDPPQKLLRAMIDSMPDQAHRDAMRGFKGTPGLAVRESMAADYRRGLQIDEAPDGLPGADLLNKLSMVGLQEAASHSSNLTSAILHPRVIRNLPKAIIGEIWGDTGHRKALLDLVEIGANKDKHLESGSFLTGKYSPKAVTGEVLHRINNVMRRAVDLAHESLVKSGIADPGEANRRDTLNQELGNYSRQATHELVKWARDTKVGSFAVAGTTFTMKGIRTGLLMDPSTRATNYAQAARLRAHVAAKIIGAGFAATAALNTAMWGNPFGDDETPFGNLKVGKDPKTGNTISWENPFVSVTKRGMRATGLMAMVEGWRKGETKGEIGKKATEQSLHSLAHPFLGPFANAVNTSITGTNAIGMRVAEPVHRGENPFPNRFLAAGLNASPLVGGLTGANTPKKEFLNSSEKEKTLTETVIPYWLRGGTAPKDDTEWYEKVAQMFGKWGPQFRKRYEKKR